MTSQSFPVSCFWSCGFVPTGSEIWRFWNIKTRGRKIAIEKFYAILISTLWRFNWANKKICQSIHTLNAKHRSWMCIKFQLRYGVPLVTLIIFVTKGFLPLKDFHSIQSTLLKYSLFFYCFSIAIKVNTFTLERNISSRRCHLPLRRLKRIDWEAIIHRTFQLHGTTSVWNYRFWRGAWLLRTQFHRHHNYLFDLHESAFSKVALCCSLYFM